ncbi:MAG: lysylphosphatidylglycerol synthase domain-containing protein, partial [Phycicoccus sp.]
MTAPDDARVASVPRRPPRRTRQVVQFVVGLGFAAVLLVWGLPVVADTSWSSIWDVIRSVPLPYFAGYQVLMLAGLYAYTLTFTGSLRGLTHGRALIVNLCGSSVANLLPGGGAAGLAATFAILRSWGFSRRATSTSAIVTGVWNVLARIALPVVAILALWAGGVTLPTVLTKLAVAGSLTGIGLLAAFAAVMASERAAQAIGSVLDRALRPLLRRTARTRAMRVDEVVRDVRARIIDVVRRAWWSMTLGMVLFFAAYYLLFVLIMRETGVQLELDLLFAAFAIGRLLSTVGITPGGVGVTETATVLVLTGWGADP